MYVLVSDTYNNPATQWLSMKFVNIKAMNALA